MHICSPQYGLTLDSNEGGRVYDYEVLRGLAALGAQLSIPVPLGTQAFDVPGWQVIPTGQHRRTYFEYNWIFYRATRGAWRTQGWDIYRVHAPTLAPLGLAMKRLSRRPLSGHYHHIEPDRRVTSLLTRLALPHYDTVTVLSQFTLGQLVQQYGLDPGRAVITPPGVGAHYQPQLPNEVLRRKYAVEGKICLLTIGVLTARKNLLFLLRVFAEARRQRHDLVLVIGGAGPQAQELAAAAQALGIADDVRFTGYMQEDEKVALLNSADLFLFPSLLEGFGMAPAEAMACECPVISSNAGSLPEVVGDAGILLAPSDEAGWVEQILRVADDPILRGELGARGRARVRSLFAWERTAQLTLQAYERAIQADARRS